MVCLLVVECVASCLLFVARCALFVEVVRCVVCCSVFAVCCLFCCVVVVVLFGVGCMLFVACWLLLVVWC